MAPLPGASGQVREAIQQSISSILLVVNRTLTLEAEPKGLLGREGTMSPLECRGTGTHVVRMLRNGQTYWAGRKNFYFGHLSTGRAPIEESTPPDIAVQKATPTPRPLDNDRYRPQVQNRCLCFYRWLATDPSPQWCPGPGCDGRGVGCGRMGLTTPTGGPRTVGDGMWHGTGFRERQQLFQTFCHPTFYVLPSLLQVFLEAESVVVAEPEVFALVSVAAELSPEGVVWAAEPESVFVVDLEVSEPGVVSVSDVAEPQASVDSAVAFDILVPVSVVVVEVDSSGRPKFLAFPNVDHYASSSSSVEVVGWESVHSSTDARTNYGLCSILSTLGLHQNKNWGPCYNNPSPGYNNGSDTNDLPIDATTNHSRKTCLHLYQEQRKHCAYQASLSHPEVPEIRWVVAEKFQYLYLPLPSLE